MQPTTQQLDIFADSRDVMLRNDVRAVATGRDGAAESATPVIDERGANGCCMKQSAGCR